MIKTETQALAQSLHHSLKNHSEFAHLKDQLIHITATILNHNQIGSGQHTKTNVIGAAMNTSTNYAKQIKNAKRGGYAPTIAKDVNKHKIQKASRLIEQWRKLANELKPQMQIDMALTLEECAHDLDQILRNKSF